VAAEVSPFACGSVPDESLATRASRGAARAAGSASSDRRGVGTRWGAGESRATNSASVLKSWRLDRGALACALLNAPVLSQAAETGSPIEGESDRNTAFACASPAAATVAPSTAITWYAPASERRIEIEPSRLESRSSRGE